jgi:hypothetical protein
MTAMYTKNISRHGMLLAWDSAGVPVPVLNEMLIVEVALPPLAGFERRCLRCQATVCRVAAPCGERIASVALHVDAMDFQVARLLTKPPEIPGHGPTGRWQ